MNGTSSWFATLDSFEEGLRQSGNPFFTGLFHGTMTCELYRPIGEDLQTPHAQDEIYIIRRGTSGFLRDGERISVSAGDALFVPAGMEHRFVDFSKDFDTWVLFWGPKGGEK